MKINHSLMAVAALFAAATVPTVAHAEEDSFFDVSGDVSLTTDYRFRGVSYSGLDPAIQGSITVGTEPGFYVGAWGSSIKCYCDASMEFNLLVGWEGSVAGFDLDVGAVGYFYPGSSDSETYEFYSTVGYTIGNLGASLGLSWAPKQDHLYRSSRYLTGGLTYAVPQTPVTLKTSVGFERGGFVWDEFDGSTTKTDWMVGADVSFSALTLGVAYIGTDLKDRRYEDYRYNREGKDGIVVTLSAGF